MPEKSWILTDLETHRFEQDWQLTAADIDSAPAGAGVTKRVLRGGLAEGVDEIRVHNGQFEFSVLPTRGMALWKGWLGDLELGWNSPVRGPVHPSHVPLHEPSGLGWLDGFDECICRCGLASNGAPDFDDQGRLAFPLHGRIANRPAHYVEVTVDDDQIRVRGIVEESRFHFSKLRMTTTYTTRFNQPGVEIWDEVTNLSGTESEMQMLYHCNFGASILEAGRNAVLPAHTIVPRNEWAAEAIDEWATYRGPTAGSTERVYFYQMLADSQGDTCALLKNAAGSRGASLRWNVEQLPCFSLWKNETSIADGYVTGFEPGTNFPNPRSFEKKQGRVVKIPASGNYSMRVSLQLHDSAESVSTTEQLIESIRDHRPTDVHDQPKADWCAD